MSSGVFSWGSRTKQSSKEGDVAPSLKVALADGTEGWEVIWPVGIEVESRARYWSVLSVTAVPSIVEEAGLRVK